MQGGPDEFTWTDGWPLRYTYWGDMGTEECTAMGENSQWTTMACDTRQPFVCRTTRGITAWYVDKVLYVFAYIVHLPSLLKHLMQLYLVIWEAC